MLKWKTRQYFTCMQHDMPKTLIVFAVSSTQKTPNLEISFFACYRGPLQISFFTKYMGAPSDQFLHKIYGGPLRSVFPLAIWGPPLVSLLAYYIGPLRSVSVHTFWGTSHADQCFLLLCGAPSDQLFCIPTYVDIRTQLFTEISTFDILYVQVLSQLLIYNSVF